jgi:hypothetical protein
MTTPTLSQLGEMTDEELNVRLLRLLGWKRRRSQNRDFKWVWVSGGGHMFATPQFCSDANAVAEVRKGMDRDAREDVVRILYHLLIPKEDQHESHFITWSILERISNASPREITIAIIERLTP